MHNLAAYLILFKTAAIVYAFKQLKSLFLKKVIARYKYSCYNKSQITLAFNRLRWNHGMTSGRGSRCPV